MKAAISTSPTLGKNSKTVSRSCNESFLKNHATYQEIFYKICESALKFYSRLPTPANIARMFRAVWRASCRTDSLGRHHIETRCCFSTSKAGATWSNDPILRELQYAARRERYRTDPIYRAKTRFEHNAGLRAFGARQSEKQRNHKYLLESFRSLVKRRLDSGEVLAWDTHVVEYTLDPKVHRCGSCDHEKVPGSRLWWRRIQDGAYECFPCFTEDMSRAIPLGYQNWLACITSKHEKAQSAVSKTLSTKQDSGSIPTH